MEIVEFILKLLKTNLYTRFKIFIDFMKILFIILITNKWLIDLGFILEIPENLNFKWFASVLFSEEFLVSIVYFIFWIFIFYFLLYAIFWDMVSRFYAKNIIYDKEKMTHYLFSHLKINKDQNKHFFRNKLFENKFKSLAEMESKRVEIMYFFEKTLSFLAAINLTNYMLSFPLDKYIYWFSFVIFSIFIILLIFSKIILNGLSRIIHLPRLLEELEKDEIERTKKL